MSSQLDAILIALRSGETTLDEACRALTAAVRQNPAGTRLWGMLIESRVTQQEISPAVGRALTDAMETYEPEKTMWLAPSSIAKAADTPAPATGDPTPTVPISGNVLRTPNTRTVVPAAPRFADAEQLRAFLWDAPSNQVKSAAMPEGVEWMGESAASRRIPPPRPMPGTTPVLQAPDLGTVIKNRYRLVAHLGYGGIGQVFSATDLELERSGNHNSHVTIKLIAVDLKREPQALLAIQNAVARTKSLRHTNIVSTYSVEHDADRVFVVMEPLSGAWLGDQLRQVRKVGVSHEIAWPIIEGIANGLAHAHQQDIVHSDLSPYAVFVTEEGTPKIMGFGLIHALPTSNEAMDLLDTMTLRAYSEAYTADTWATHAIPHPADDLYPLGAIAYELFTGTHPFNRQSLTTARLKKLQWEPIPNLNRRATKLLARCLSFERTERPKNATRFVAGLQGPAFLRAIFGGRFSVAGTATRE